MGTLKRTVSALRILNKAKATTCWHQKMSLASQLHVTDVILHLQSINTTKSINTHQLKKHSSSSSSNSNNNINNKDAKQGQLHVIEFQNGG